MPSKKAEEVLYVVGVSGVTSGDDFKAILRLIKNCGLGAAMSSVVLKMEQETGRYLQKAPEVGRELKNMGVRFETCRWPVLNSRCGGSHIEGLFLIAGSTQSTQRDLMQAAQAGVSVFLVPRKQCMGDAAHE